EEQRAVELVAQREHAGPRVLEAALLHEARDLVDRGGEIHLAGRAAPQRAQRVPADGAHAIEVARLEAPHPREERERVLRAARVDRETRRGEREARLRA